MGKKNWSKTHPVPCWIFLNENHLVLWGFLKWLEPVVLWFWIYFFQRTESVILWFWNIWRTGIGGFSKLKTTAQHWYACFGLEIGHLKENKYKPQSSIIWVFKVCLCLGIIHLFWEKYGSGQEQTMRKKKQAVHLYFCTAITQVQNTCNNNYVHK